MKHARWYFDLISPFAYLHWHRLGPLRARLQIEPVPVLFAGLLKHWDTRGPAETPTKRLHTYQYCVWAASQAGLAFRMPPRHPFNSLAAMRLLVAIDADDRQIERAFDFVFAEGRDPELDFAGLAAHLDVADGAALVAQPEVKRKLIENTEQAIGAGVFGVPTLAIDGQLFWGSETLGLAARFLDDPELFQGPEYIAAANTQFGVARR